MRKVVLLLNMGGPNNESEISLFLKNMFDDPYILGIKSRFLRKFLSRLITFFRKKAARENYSHFDFKSPINEYSRELIAKLNAKNGAKFDYVMNYTPPFADEVLTRYQDFDEITLFPLYPHFSKTTVLSSLESAKNAAKRLNLHAKISEIPPFFKSEKYNQIVLNLIKEALLKFDGEISDLTLIFSAHSLPKKHIENGDIYEADVNSHVEILKTLLKQNGLNFKEVILAYQSRLGPVEWLGPNLGDALANLANKKALIFPIAFCVDNSETEFELDIFYRDVAKKENFDFYEVCKCPNSRDDFVEFIFENS